MPMDHNFWILAPTVGNDLSPPFKRIFPNNPSRSQICAAGAPDFEPPP